jgi:group I intron endonuclease
MKIIPSPLKITHSRNTNFTLRRSYSTSSSSEPNTPTPVLTITDLRDKNLIFSKSDLLLRKGGIYSFLNKVNGKQYIVSAKDLYLRLNEHLSHKKSNRDLQAISKYGIDNFHFCIYEFFTYENKATSFKFLTCLETMYIRKFKFNDLYNFLENASSSKGYKHTDEAKQKMVKRLEDKNNHPFWGKHNDDKTKSLIGKPGVLNPMFGKTQSEETKKLMRIKRVKYPNGVGIYDLENHLIKSFYYASDLAIYLNKSKVAVSKYINNGLVFEGKYYLKVNPFKE